MASLKIEYSKLEKYLKDKKKEYGHDLFELSEEFEASKTYIKGHLHMIDMLLDDLDSFLSYDVLGVVKETSSCECNKNCESCFIAEDMKHKFLEECDSVFDAASDYANFINMCAEMNGNK